MEKSCFHIALLVSAVFVSGCAGRGYRTSPHTSSSHLYSPGHSQVDPANQSDFGQPQLADPLKSEFDHSVQPVQTVPAPPAQGVSQVKRVGFSKILFGADKNCGETATANNSAHACGEQPAGTYTKVKGWCSRLSPFSSKKQTCAAESPATAPCAESGCVTGSHCVDGTCHSQLHRQSHTRGILTVIVDHCKRPFCKHHDAKVCETQPCVPDQSPCTSEGCGAQQECAKPLLDGKHHSAITNDVHLMQDPFEQSAPQSEVHTDAHSFHQPPTRPEPPTYKILQPDSKNSVDEKPSKLQLKVEDAPALPKSEPQENLDSNAQSLVEPRVWPRLRTKASQPLHRRAETISYPVKPTSLK